ncbi:DUF2268 domain-containing putative Zn-dependent protease [Candidatus Avelusimicrobium luingense]|uniref:DUF2268 domain-containing putative Zn-dependent protease n=1 Tax=Candidatus Avelusimicrobium luingense TaxID=3416211 RepID=UPI003D09A42D
MKKTVVILTISLAINPLWGQTQSPSIRVSNAAPAPESNIDLLKQSLKKSAPEKGIVGVAPISTSTPTATNVSNEPVKKSTPTTPAANPAVTLDMPLTVGGETQSVQTAVAPTKTLSPKVADKVAASKKERAKAEAKKPADKKSVSLQQAAPATSKPTELEKNIETDNALLPPGSTVTEEADLNEEEAAADAELEYAVKMMEQSKAKAQSTERPIPPSAAQNKPDKVPAPNKKFNPNAFRPGVTWQESKSTHFDVYTQKRTEGIPSSNMTMTFETAYQTLRRFIPWMMSNRVRVFVYQDHKSYLRHEPNAKAWTRAVAYPTRGEIVVYDEPGKQRELQEVFTHELTHIFTQQFFDSHKTGRIMTPTWLDEGLAVFMEDQSAGSKGGPWADDLKTLNFQRDPSQENPSLKPSSLFGSSRGKRFTSKRDGKPVYLVPFEQFMQEGSLEIAEGRNDVQNWYFQAYAMVRFLLNPAGGSTPSNRMQFEQFTRLIAQGEPKRDPSTGFLVKDSRGKTVYEPYSVEKALGRAYHYNNTDNFEDNFWRWVGQ